MLERCHGTYSPNINIHIAEDFPKLPTSTLCTPGMHAISAWLTCMPNLALSQDLPVPSVFLPGIPPHPSGRARSLRCRFWCTVQNAAIDAVTPKPPHKLPTCIDWTPTAKTHPEPPWTALINLLIYTIGLPGTVLQTNAAADRSTPVHWLGCRRRQPERLGCLAKPQVRLLLARQGTSLHPS